MLYKQRVEQYSKFKESLSNSTTNTAPTSVSDTPRDQVLDRARLLINKIKEHWHNKLKQNNKANLNVYITKDMDAIIISTAITNFLTTSITIPMFWVDNQMCHLVVHLDLPHLPSLPVFLPHPWPPHLPPAQPPLNQPKQTQPVATLSAPIHVETTWTNGS